MVFPSALDKLHSLYIEDTDNTDFLWKDGKTSAHSVNSVTKAKFECPRPFPYRATRPLACKISSIQVALNGSAYDWRAGWHP